MTLMKMPMFVWTWLITAFLLIAIMPVLAGAVTMMLLIGILARAFLTLQAVGILFYFNIYFGFLVILKCMFWFCLLLVLFQKSFPPLAESLYLVIISWFMRRFQYCHFVLYCVGASYVYYRCSLGCRIVFYVHHHA